MAQPLSSRTAERRVRELESAHVQRRPQLTLVRTGNAVAARRVLVLVGFLCTAFVGIVALEANLASGQMELDKLNKTVRLARDHYEELRQERAMLHAPDVLQASATKLRMFLAPTTKFLPVEKSAVAVVDEAISSMDARFADPAQSSLDKFGHVVLGVKGVGE